MAVGQALSPANLMRTEARGSGRPFSGRLTPIRLLDQPAQHSLYNSSRANQCRQSMVHTSSGSRPILRFDSGNREFAATASPFRRFWSGSPVGRPRSKSSPTTPNWNPKTSWPSTPMLPNWRQGARSRDDEAPLRRKSLAAAHSFILVSTDADFETLSSRTATANVVILRSRNYPTEVAVQVLRRNAIRIAEIGRRRRP